MTRDGLRLDKRGRERGQHALGAVSGHFGEFWKTCGRRITCNAIARSREGQGSGGTKGDDAHPSEVLQLVVKSSSLANWNGLSVSVRNLLATSGILR